MSTTEDRGGGVPRPSHGDEPGHFGTYQAFHPTTDVLASAGPEPEPGRAPWAVVALAGCLVLALVGGVSWAVGSLSGGGAQPEDALPAGAVAFAKIDLDPSAGQKIDGFRFLRKFPALRDRIPLDGDVRRVLFEAFAEQAGWQDVDFDTEVDPWLGDRVGVAGYPAAAENGAPGVVALQVTDADQAEAGLRRLVDASQDGLGGTASVGFVVQDDYALLAETQELAETYARKAAERSLAEDERYAADLAEIGDGVAAGWVDNAAAGEAGSLLDSTVMGLPGVAGLGSTAGRTTMVARFDGPDVFEVVGSFTDVGPAGWATHPVSGLGDLPDSTVMAFGLADGDELAPRLVDAVRAASDQPDGGKAVDEMLAEVEDELGLELPEDLAVVLGDNLLAALDESGDGSVLETGVRVRTDVERARRVLAPLLEDWPDTVLRPDGDSYLLATTDGQADRMASGGALADRPGFRQALPDLQSADVAFWADPAAVLQTLFRGWGGPDAEQETDSGLEPIAGVGITATSRADGEGSFRFRIVAR